MIPLLLCAQVVCAQTVRIKLQSSSNLSQPWQDAPLTATAINADGSISAAIGTNALQSFYRVQIFQPNTNFPSVNLVYVEGGSLSGVSVIGPISVQSFCVSRYETSIEEWSEVVQWASTNGYDLATRGQSFGAGHPVHSVDWYDAAKWCNAKSEKEGLPPVYKNAGAIYRSGQILATRDLTANGYRLPSEAEWEFAFRGGIHSRNFVYSGSTNVLEVSWYAGNSSSTAIRGTKLANELGLHDMGGNIWEWLNDGSSVSKNRRGGGWTSPASICDRTGRGSATPNSRNDDIGFRYVRSVSP